MISYNTIQILLSTPHGGFSEKNINNADNQKMLKNRKKKIIKKLSAYKIYDIIN